MKILIFAAAFLLRPPISDGTTLIHPQTAIFSLWRINGDNNHDYKEGTLVVCFPQCHMFLHLGRFAAQQNMFSIQI